MRMHMVSHLFSSHSNTSEKSYIGETDKNSSSFIAKHHMQTGHKVVFGETKIVSRIPYYHQPNIREAVEIIKQPNSINRNDCYPCRIPEKTVINPLTRNLTISGCFRWIAVRPQITSTVTMAINRRQSSKRYSKSELNPEDVVHNDTRNVGILDYTVKPSMTFCLCLLHDWTYLL